MPKSQSTLQESTPISSIKLAPDAVNRMLDELDANQTVPKHNQRKDDRLSFRCTAVIVIVNQSGYESTFLNPVRNISKNGIAFLHRSMLHKGTQCVIRIRTPDLKWLQVTGDVVRSRYIRSMVYEIGLKFVEPIDLAKNNLIGQ